MNTRKTQKPWALVIFIALSYLFVFLMALPGILENYGVAESGIPVLPLLVIGSWTPNLAAFLVIAFVIRQKGGVKALLKRWGMWKVSPWWYLAAASPLFFSALAALLYHLVDGQALRSTEPVNYSFLAGFLFIALITGAMGEELGWRGFALPWLQTRFNALGASVIIGSVWAVWHLPLWFTGMGWNEISFWLFAYNCIAMSVIITWICNNTRGNMLLVTLFHMFYNFGMGVMGEVWNVPQDKSLVYLAIVLSLFTLIAILVYKPSKLTKEGVLPVNYAQKTWSDI